MMKHHFGEEKKAQADAYDAQSLLKEFKKGAYQQAHFCKNA